MRVIRILIIINVKAVYCKPLNNKNNEVVIINRDLYFFYNDILIRE